MRQILRFALAGAFLTAGFAVQAQSLKKAEVETGFKLSKPVITGIRATTCDVDITDYSYEKEDTLGKPTTYYAYTEAPGDIAATTFYVDQPVTIYGAAFVGRAGSTTAGTTINVLYTIWNVDGTGMPTTLIAQDTGTATNAVAYNQVLFDAPVVVSDSFAVAVQSLDPTIGVRVFMSGLRQPTDTTAYDEMLSFENFDPGTGAQWFAVSDPNNWGFDFEWTIAPIVGFDIDAAFTSSATTACPNAVVSFTNQSSSILENRQFNRHTFDTKWLLEADSTFAWNFGDGSAVVYAENPTHMFTAPGTYTVTLTTTRKGYYSAECVDTETMVITVPAPNASFTVDMTNEPNIAFTNTSNASTYVWDFGDGGSSTDVDPMHTYTAVGNYDVILYATDTCGTTVTDTMTITITTVGVSAKASSVVKVYPNPVTEVLNISAVNANNATVTVFDILGNVVATQKVVSGNAAVNVTSLAAGTYIVSVRGENITENHKINKK